jgi:hypothetical protein
VNRRTAIAAFIAWMMLFGITGLSVGYNAMTAISCGLSTIVLLLTMLATETHGWAVVWTLFVAYGLIGTVNIMLEGVFFNIFPIAAGMRFLASGLITGFALSAAMVLVAGKMSAERYEGKPAQLRKGWLLRLPVLAFAYVILFFVAGGLVYPYVRHFYENRVMPSMGSIVGGEFVRGLIYAVAMLPAARLMSGHRWRAAAILGLCLSVFGGVAPILLPNNKYLPADILPYHLVEVGCENFLLGVIGAWLFVTKTARPDATTSSSKTRDTVTV